MSETNTNPEADADAEAMEPYAENTALADALGDHPKVHILSVMLSAARGTELTPVNIAEHTGHHRTTIYRHIDGLEDYGIIRKVRTVGRTPVYELNTNSPLAKQLAEFEWALIAEHDKAVDEDEDEDVDVDVEPEDSPPHDTAVKCAEAVREQLTQWDGENRLYFKVNRLKRDLDHDRNHIVNELLALERDGQLTRWNPDTQGATVWRITNDFEPVETDADEGEADE